MKKPLILIVEDDVISFQLLKIILEKIGLDYIWAKNGKEAVEMFKFNTISLIFMDITMSIMGGVEATKIIRLIDSNIPIIAQTAHAHAHDKQKLISIGCTDYISKPMIRRDIIRMIRKYLTF
jgi:CheY-like chemotaxis protein